MSAELPIIFLTARDSDFDLVAGLRLGADDYLTKDISMPHLLARIAALFRRIDVLRSPPKSEETVDRGALQLDLKRMTAVWRSQAVDLTLTEFWMVHALAKYPGHVKSRDHLMSRREPRRRRRDGHLAHQAHPPQVPGGRRGVRRDRHRVRHGLPLGIRLALRR